MDCVQNGPETPRSIIPSRFHSEVERFLAPNFPPHLWRRRREKINFSGWVHRRRSKNALKEDCRFILELSSKMIDSVFRKSQSETPPASNKYVFSISQRKCVSILFYALVSAKIPLFLCFLLTMENTSYDCLIVYSDRDITQSL